MEAGEGMKIYEFGMEHERTFVLFQCAAEPWWVFKASAEAMARDYHVYLVIADGHDETGTDFISLEKNVKDAADALRQKGVTRIEAMYGVSMGGASVIRFLATEDISVDRAIIDGHHALSVSALHLPAHRCQGLDHDHAGHQIHADDEAGGSARPLDTQGRGP